MTTWDGVSPLTPDHEVAYRGWPTKRVRIVEVVNDSYNYPVVTANERCHYAAHTKVGKFRIDGFESRYDLVPLQKEPDHE